VVIAAAGPGKLKTVIQNIFVGAVMLWFAFRDARKPLGWEHSKWAQFWNTFHGGFVAVALLVAAALTVYSFGVYMYRYRRLFSEGGSPRR
jgi:phosphatidylglycerophosphate synthase